MPQKYAPEELKIGDMQRVFIYRDSGGRLVATTERPFWRSAKWDFCVLNR